MVEFRLHAPYQPTGDQPEAVSKLVEGLKRGDKHQVLLGATGTGKTYTIANVIEAVQRPADDNDGRCRLVVQLAAREGATGRPEELILTLGVNPTSTRIARTRLLFQ